MRVTENVITLLPSGEGAPKGRMRALASALLLQDQQNPIENVNKRREHIAIQDAVNLEAFAFEKGRPPFIVPDFMCLAVCRAIQFDHQLVTDADKVSDVRWNGNLPPEFVAAQTAVPQVTP